MPIPKIIHYCWFGDAPLPNQYAEYIEGWKRICPDYTIQKWLEFYIDKCLEFGQETENILLSEGDIIKIIELFKEKTDYRVSRYRSEYFDADDIRLFIEQDNFKLGEIFGIYFDFGV